MKKTFLFFLQVAFFAATISTTVSASEPYDPIEPVNRAVFTFNEYADMIVLKPVAQAYDYAVPSAGKQGVSNVLNNLNMPIVFTNSVLQGDPENAFGSLWSFLLNSTFGIAGIFDFTGANTNLNVRPEDFGQTLGAWGVGEGMYIVLPFLGSSSARDTTGMFVDFFTDPYNMIKDDRYIIARIALTAIDARYQALDVVDDVYETSFDPYATFRSAYWQRRQAMISNTKSRDLNNGM